MNFTDIINKLAKILISLWLLKPKMSRKRLVDIFAVIAEVSNFKIKNTTQRTFWYQHNNNTITRFYIIYSIVTKILVLTTQALVQNLVQIQILVKLYISDRPSGGNKTHTEFVRHGRVLPDC